MEAQLQLYASDSNILISRYLFERHREQRAVEEGEYSLGSVNVRVQLLREHLRVEVLNARHLKPPDPRSSMFKLESQSKNLICFDHFSPSSRIEISTGSKKETVGLVGKLNDLAEEPPVGEVQVQVPKVQPARSLGPVPYHKQQWPLRSICFTPDYPGFKVLRMPKISNENSTRDPVSFIRRDLRFVSCLPVLDLDHF